MFELAWRTIKYIPCWFNTRISKSQVGRRIHKITEGKASHRLPAVIQHPLCCNHHVEHGEVHGTRNWIINKRLATLGAFAKQMPWQVQTWDCIREKQSRKLLKSVPCKTIVGKKTFTEYLLTILATCIWETFLCNSCTQKRRWFNIGSALTSIDRIDFDPTWFNVGLALTVHGSM